MADIRKRSGSKGITYQVRYPSKGSKSGYAFKTFQTLKEAREFRESGKTKKLGYARSGGGIITVADGIEKWLEVCEKEGRDGRDPVTDFTLKGYKYRASVIKSYSWEKTLPELTAPDIVEFRSWLLGNYPRSMAHFVLSSFHSMILEMVFRGVLPHDVAARVSIREHSRYEEPVTIPSEKEVMDLLAAADKLANSKNRQIQRTWERYRPILYLAADSGMRPQEYLAVADAAVRDRGVHVTRAVERSGDKLSVPKTAAGRRFIDLSPEVYKMVRHYADHHAVENDHDLIFPTSTGSWLTPENWRNRGFSAACSEAGLVTKTKVKGKIVEKPKYVPYHLRHFYASVLIANRKDPKTIQTLMGHEDIKTTLNVYGHLLKRLPAKIEPTSGMLATLRTN
jgi:integrase